jgi:hypothetical protein
MKRKPNSDEFWLECLSGIKVLPRLKFIFGLCCVTLFVSESAQWHRQLTISPPVLFHHPHPFSQIADLVRELANEDAVSATLQPRTDLFDPSLLFRDLNLFSDLIPLGPLQKHTSKVELQAAGRGGSFARIGAATGSSLPLVEMIDPIWIEGALDDGKKFWYKKDDPKNPTFVKPLVPPTLQAARALWQTGT